MAPVQLPEKLLQRRSKAGTAERRTMRRLLAIMLSVSLTAGISVNVMASTLDYKAAVNKIEAKGTPAVIQYFEDGKGNKGKMVVSAGKVYSSHASLRIREYPNADAKIIQKLSFGESADRVGLCDNGWSKLVLTVKGKKVYGYTESYYLSSKQLITKMDEQLVVVQDAQVLNFPGTRDGLSVGEVSVDDVVTCTGMCSDNWSQIAYTDKSGKKITGFLQNDVMTELKREKSKPKEKKKSGHLEDPEENEWEEDMIEGEALIEEPSSDSASESIWAKAATENLQDATAAANAIIVNEGEAVNVSSTAKLKPLGEFRITHYCACSICCGPYSGMNSTASGVPPVTNRTIAVEPKQIPYGTQVVINGQVYVAEDCGGAIKKNCIDIYVASHEEASSKGMYYTDVYLLTE